MEDIDALVETHHEPGTPALDEKQPPAIHEPEGTAETKEPQAPEVKTPSLPEGFSEEKWQKLVELEKEYEQFRPALEKRGIMSLRDAAELLEEEPDEDVADTPAPSAPATSDEFWQSLKPGEQTWVNNFKKHMNIDGLTKDTKSLRGHVSDVMFDNWMLRAQVDNLLESLGQMKDLNIPKLDANPREVRRVLDTFGKTLIPRALKAGKNPAAEAIAYLLSQKPAQKPTVPQGPSGIDKGLRTERPGGVPTGEGKPPFPMLADGSDFDWEKMDTETMYKALSWVSKQREAQGR